MRGDEARRGEGRGRECASLTVTDIRRCSVSLGLGHLLLQHRGHSPSPGIGCSAAPNRGSAGRRPSNHFPFPGSRV